MALSRWAINQDDLDYATANDFELYFNDRLAIVGDEMESYDDMYVQVDGGRTITSVYGGEPDGPFAQPKPVPTISGDGTRAYFDYNDWGGDLTQYEFTITASSVPVEPNSVLITQDDLDYAATNGLTVQIDDVIVTAPTDWVDGTTLTVNIDNGVIVRIEIPSDPFGDNSVKPTIATDSHSARFNYAYYEGSLNAYEFIIELDTEQPNSKGVSDTYLVASEDIRRIIKDKYQMTIGFNDDGSANTRDLSKYMLGLIAVPFPINDDFVLTPDKPIKLGQYDTDYVGDLLKGDILSIDVGSITTPKTYDNALAYQGKTAILHLPYTDAVALDIDYVVGETVTIRYDINLYDGFTVVNIMSSKINDVVSTLYIDLDIKVPFANVDYGQPSTGDPYNISIGGDNGVRQAFIEVLSYDAVLADGFYTIPITDEALISTVSGYMTIDNVDLVSTATRAEKAMIISQLESGVIIN